VSEIILKLSGLSKSYKKGMGFKRFYGLNHFSLDISKGEILGVIGPNGAGKTTTFKLILGLIYPDKGKIEFGPTLSDGNSDPRNRIGFLPENPYFYSYLTVEESIHFYARLFNFKKARRQSRVDELLELVGMAHARKRQLGKLSRGMLQRVGIAQAILNDPDLLILDEPMSGLDPIGRKEIRDIIINFSNKGKTVIFSSHILSDVEMICDRVAMIMDGELNAQGSMDDVFGDHTHGWEIEYEGPPLDFGDGCQVDRKGKKYIIKIWEEAVVGEIFTMIQNSEGNLLSFNPKRVELEKIYMHKAGVNDSDA